MLVCECCGFSVPPRVMRWWSTRPTRKHRRPWRVWTARTSWASPSVWTGASSEGRPRTRGGEWAALGLVLQRMASVRATAYMSIHLSAYLIWMNIYHCNAVLWALSMFKSIILIAVECLICACYFYSPVNQIMIIIPWLLALVKPSLSLQGWWAQA